MRRRIVICLGLLLLVCLLGDLAAMLCLGQSIHRLSSSVDSHRIQWLRANLSSDGVRVQTDLLSYLSGHEHSPELRDENAQRFVRSLDRCSRCHHPVTLSSRFERLRESFDLYQATANRLFDATDAAEQRALAQDAIILADRFVEQTTTMSDEADQHLTASSSEVAGYIRTAWIVLSVTLVVLLIGGGFVAIHLKNRLTQPVETLLRGIVRAGRGHPEEPMLEQADAEFRVLGQAFHQAYADLTTAKDSILQAEKLAATGMLVAGVAHEVLNPLASISSIAQMIGRHSSSDVERDQAKLIETEIGRVSKVVRELLDFTRPAEDDSASRVDLESLLDQAATLVGYDSRAQRIGITREYAPALPSVRGHSERLLPVFTNILINALDAVNGLNTQPASIAISTRAEDSEVVVDIRDQGHGMSAHELAHAFDPFFTTKEPGAGTGLGLWICYQVVQRHGGRIDIESAPGEGTNVAVRLPADSPRMAAEYPVA